MSTDGPNRMAFTKSCSVLKYISVRRSNFETAA
jgi:hypothetical protein